MEVILERSKTCTYPMIKENAYVITTSGKVYSILSGRYLTPYVDRDGYEKVSPVNSDGKNRHVFIHRLVAWEFCDNPDPKKYTVVDHLDGNKRNNNCSNLEWVTVKENTNRAERMGLRKVRGESNGSSKYTEAFVKQICEYFEKGYSVTQIYRKLTNEYTISDHNFYCFIRRIGLKELWFDVAKNYNYTPQDVKRRGSDCVFTIKDTSLYTEKFIHKICQLYQQGMRPVDVLKYFKGNSVTCRDEKHLYDLLGDIYRHKRWRYISDQYVFN